MLTATDCRRVVQLASSMFMVAVLLAPGAVASAAGKAAGASPSVLAVRSGELAAEGGRIVVELSAPARFKSFALDGPDRVVVDLPAARVRPGAQVPTAEGVVRGVRVAPRGAGSRLVVDLAAPVAHRVFAVAAEGTAPARIVIELGKVPTLAATPKAPVTAGSPAPDRAPAAARVDGDAARERVPEAVAAAHAPRTTGRDLVIAVDAGHGGRDPGASGLNGGREKDITLAVARKLAAAINAEPGMRAVLIRDGDYFVDLRQRMVRARAAKADLFVSIHADAAPNRSAAGSSVYILSTRGASSEAARWLADRENAADLAGGVQLDGVEPVVASVLMDLSQGDTISASDRAARRVLEQLQDLGRVHKPEVQSAGFIVLKSPDIPSMLVETAFISHPGEEKRLKDPAHQQRLADAILDGLRNYFYANPPAGTRVAQLAARRNNSRIAAGGTR
jgi:N-acetylmuramoyl-L-alanine amidase